MWQTIGVLFRKLERWRHQYNIDRSLALHLRGEARSDGLSLIRVRNRLEVRWRARDIHPWDAQASNKAQLFGEQLLADTEAVILRLFKALPQVDVIDLKVVVPTSDAVIMSGVVHRSDLDTVRRLMSIRMRLQQMGVSSWMWGTDLASSELAEEADERVAEMGRRE
ncbi:MAG: hypothetical protein DMG57_43415 [Acidobacteria bacterium]|nr:MAG: hypothetical protein DMG57_43415 [Acidobacteriota bacterium]